MKYSIGRIERKKVQSNAPVVSSVIPRIVVVDDHKMMRSAIGMAVVKAVGRPSDAELSALTELNGELRCHGAGVVILDLTLGEEDVRPHLPKLVIDFPNTRFLILSALSNPRQIAEVMHSGVHGFVHKSQGVDVICQAIRAVWLNHHFLCDRSTAALMESIKGNLVDKNNGNLLTKRERQLLLVLAAGTNIKKAAEVLGISEKTVYTHRDSLFRKTGTSDNVGLVCYSIRRGLFELPS